MKKANLILLLSSFTTFLLFALLGIGTIGVIYHPKYIDYRNSLYMCLGDIFVPIIGGLFLILLPLTILYCLGKLRFVLVHKFMSALDFFGVFGVSLAQLIIVLVSGGTLTSTGYIVYIAILLTISLSFASGVLCVVQFFILLRRYLSKNKTSNYNEDYSPQKHTNYQNVANPQVRYYSKRNDDDDLL